MDVGLAHFERQALAKRYAKGEFVEEAAVNARDRNGASFSAAVDCLAQRMKAVGRHHRRGLYTVIPGVEGVALGLKPHTIDHMVWPAAGGQVAQLVKDVLI